MWVDKGDKKNCEAENDATYTPPTMVLLHMIDYAAIPSSGE
jgi:hypothetical protein